MTNQEIITRARFELMNKKMIGTTGRKLTIPTADGGSTEIYEPAEIHTFKEWKRRGYVVKKGEHAIIKLVIWVPFSSKKDADDISPETDGEKVTKMKMKTAFFFSPRQVEKIAEAAPAV